MYTNNEKEAEEWKKIWFGEGRLHGVELLQIHALLGIVDLGMCVGPEKDRSGMKWAGRTLRHALHGYVWRAGCPWA